VHHRSGPARSRRAALSALAGVLALLACTATASARTARATSPPPSPLNTTGIYVQGSHLMQGGLPFVARGVQITGLVAPDADLAGKYIAAYQHFGAPELAAAVADHANLIRFQVSEFGLNPADPLYDPNYLPEIEQGVALARAAGLNVIVSLQAESPAGNETRCPLPDAGAATDWNELAAAFAGDDDVMFELYNEPGLGETRANWSLWANGGVIANGAGGQCTAVGVQSLVDEIRAVGADNVIILPGLIGEQTLAGVPSITDPADPSDPQLAYGIHYPNLTQVSNQWDAEFGNFAERRPVIVTEWQANGTTNCIADSPRTAPLLLTYLALKQIGVVGFAFDLPGTIVADYNYDPTTYTDFACGQFTGGAGQILFQDYAGEAAQATQTSGVGSPGSWLLGVGELTQLDALDAGVTQQALNTPRTFVLGSDSAELQAMGLDAATPAQAFTSETALAQAVNTGAVAPGTQAVVLDLGRASPVGQQRHPRTTFELAALQAHRNGYLFVAAPQINLIKTLAPHSRPADANIDFLRRDLAGAAAKDSDALVLPFGSAQKQTRGYADITQIAAQQANAVSPGIQIIDGLTIGSHSTVTSTALTAAARATSGVVTGYSLTGQSAGGSASSLGLLQQLYASAG
jgi:endoglucanase